MKSAKMHKTKKVTRRKLQQSSSSFDDCSEESTDQHGKDFGTLINAPLSIGGHFIFKSEKTWSVDSSQYSEFFTLNLKTLSAAIDCIPFNDYVDVDDKYFTSDQLTSIYNNAEKGKAYIDLDPLYTSSSSNVYLKNENPTTDQSKNLEHTTNTKFESKDCIDNLEEDIDFLLSLKEPVQNNVITIAQPVSISHSNGSTQKPKDMPNKSIDLEKWLDSILND